MSVSLSKGQRVDLTKGRPSLKNIFVGLGWDINHYDGEADFDLDASAFMTKANGKVGSDGDFIFYGNLAHSSKSVVHMGDNRTGEGEGDDEVINIKLDQVPVDYETIAVTVTIYDAENRLQREQKITTMQRFERKRSSTIEHLRASQKSPGNERQHRMICEMRIKST